MSSKKAPPTRFVAGEKVLCFHGLLLYEAKVLKVDTAPGMKYLLMKMDEAGGLADKAGKKEEQVLYLVHYAGWNTKWDEWVKPYRILKYTPVSLEQQAELFKQYGGKQKGGGPPMDGPMAKASPTLSTASATSAAKKSSKRPASPALSTASSGREGSESGGTSKRRRKAAASPAPALAILPDLLPQPETVESPKAYMATPAIRIKLPQELRAWLVDDWDLVYNQYKLVGLPARRTVDQLLEDFKEWKKTQLAKDSGKAAEKSASEADDLDTFVKGILEYFNASLSSQFLMKFERPQYVDSCGSEKRASSVYGASHLLRFIAKNGEMLADTGLSKAQLDPIIDHIKELCVFLNSNASTVFSHNDYIIASPEYQRRAV